MRNFRRIAALFLVIAALLVSGCAEDKPSGDSNEPSGIAFEYFYRGFTPVTQETAAAFESVLGTRVILTEDDWNDFAQRFCPTAGAFSAPDFTKECLVAFSGMYGSRAGENSAADIKAIAVNSVGNAITAELADAQPDRIYAENIDGIGHWFVNIVKISKNDLPPNTEDVYTAQH
ncbi:MAG: hypothetical protein LBN02_10240 [Oscillospiraceae bacterium]|nr:hypothetical protein [Oscillospiraceae bacterium]